MNTKNLKEGAFYFICYIDTDKEESEDWSYSGLGKLVAIEEDILCFYTDFNQDELEEVYFNECDIVRLATKEEIEDWKNNQILDFVDKLNEFINE